MLTSSLFASLHYLALALGLSSVFLRGRFLRSLQLSPDPNPILKKLFVADNFWALAAFLWIATGAMRAFAGLEKGTEFYIHSSLFWVKMGLFLAVFALEIWPMTTFIRWRLAFKKNQPLPGLQNAKVFWHINHVQLILVVLIPFVASAMARGL